MADERPETVKVTILGAEYGIRATTDHDYIIKVAKYVDHKMREITEQQSIASNTRVAILAAMDIADELFQERQKRQQLLLDIETKTSKMVNLIEKYMPFAREDETPVEKGE